MKRWISLIFALLLCLSLGTTVFATWEETGDRYFRQGQANESTNQGYAGYNYYYAGQCYETDSLWQKAADAYSAAVRCFRGSGLNAKELEHAQAKLEEVTAKLNSATFLSESNMTIVVGVACLAVGCGAALIIVRKKKKNAAE